jgi:hypothetical protein
MLYTGVPTAAALQVLFPQPEGLQIRWDVTGVGQFDSTPLIVPGRYNFPQGGIYRLKLTNIGGPGREGVELYPTLEIGPTTPRSAAFLAHNAIPVEFLQEDFDQVLAGNFVTKVIYLPDPEFQGQAVVGVGTLVSTRLDPGVDPIVEADRRGAIMAVVRMGNKDMEMAGATGDMSGYPMAAGYANGYANGYGGGCPPCGPIGAMAGAGAASGVGGMPPDYVSGVTAGQWGMPMCGTPIGLPGPPHIPLGVPAGLQKHVIRNYTPMYMPPPTRQVKMHVRQQPGYSYPRPPSRVFIREQSIHPTPRYGRPLCDKCGQSVDGPGAECQTCRQISCQTECQPGAQQDSQPSFEPSSEPSSQPE